MADLEAKLKEAADARFRLIATDGVFSMDGIIADLKSICDLADHHDALVMVDDSHAVGFMGKTGRGTHEYRDVMGRVDILTGTLGKALGGASGGYTSGRAEIIDLLRQRSRPYLFSNSVAPPILGASLKAIEICRRSTELRDTLEANTTVLPRGDDRAELQHRPGRTPDHADHDRRRRPGRTDGREAARKGSLRDRLLLSRRAPGQGPRPRAGLGRPQPGRPRTLPSKPSPPYVTSWECERFVDKQVCRSLLTMPGPGWLGQNAPAAQQSFRGVTTLRPSHPDDFRSRSVSQRTFADLRNSSNGSDSNLRVE